MDNTTQLDFSSHLQTIELTRELLADPINVIGQRLAQTLAKGGTLFWCGNGGSAADSQHLAAELVGRFKKDRRALRSIALTTDTSVLTCVANDYSFDDIFARQVEALGRPGDVLIGISTSGNSENVLRAFKAAKEMSMMTIALLGKGGGPAKELADHALVIPSDSTARIQEAHILIGHILCDLIEQELQLA
ncbi:MAG: phosphoheptose isomerase [Chloroflexi bacterium RBG_16_52_11]|nr:MAG: phosphoheptose isomerase [Chloroflexi bacterium RBG_16_52_11]